jgi:thiamine kinase-like enzyme
MEPEYKTLAYLYEFLMYTKDSFGAIRPLLFIDQYPALVMEEYPSRTLRQLLLNHRSTKPDWESSELRNAARKTGEWLYTFHHKLYTPTTQPYTTSDILLEAQAYAERIEFYSRGRAQAHAILDDFSKKLESIQIDRITFSHSHSDMTVDNVLYSEDGKVCLIDIKNKVAPVYVDLGLILIHPETSKPQIFSMGTYYPESLLSKYRAELIAGYFEEQPGNEVLARIYSAIQVLNKWLMYEELMHRYKGIKHLLAIPTGPYVTAYFKSLLKKHLELICDSSSGQAGKMEEATTSTSA